MVTHPAPSRNDPCPCGSGKKFKKCCGAPAAAAPASPAQLWHDLDDRLTKDLSDFARRRFGDGWAHLLADYPVDEQDFEEVPAHVNLFIQWGCHEHKFEGKPVAEHYLESRGRNLPPRDRAWLEAHQRAWLSIWEVVELEEGAWLELVDLLTGERRRVIEIGGSRGMHKRLALLARVVDHAGLSLLCGSHPHPLPPDGARRVLEAIRGTAGTTWATKRVDPARLRAADVPTVLIDLWQQEVHAMADRPLPRLTNTDGEELVIVKDTYALVGAGAREEMARRLAAEPDIQPPEGPRGAFVIEARGRDDPADSLTTVVTGRVTMTARELRLETNSRERADRLRERLKQLGDGRVRHKKRTETDAGQMLEQASRHEGSGARRSMPLSGPAADAAVLSFKQTHYAEWVDHPVPALDDLSPREAAANPALRARLAQLIKEMEELEGRGPAGQRFDFDVIRRELGLRDA